MASKILAWPCWYFDVALLWASFQGVRGAIEQQWINDNRAAPQKLTGYRLWVIAYLHDVGYRFVCTMAGFIALYACYAIISELKVTEVTPGVAALLAAAFLVAVLGVGGQLHYFLYTGKIPGLKGGD